MPDKFHVYRHGLRSPKVIFLLAAVVLLLGGGWWAYNHDVGPIGKLKNNGQSAHKLPPAGTLQVDKSNLPDNWKSQPNNDNPQETTASNISKGSDPAKACQVSIEVKKDSSAHASSADAYAQALKDNLTQPLRINSDYQFQDLPKQTLTVKTEDGTKQVSAFYWQYKSPNTGITNYDKVAFYIKDGAYARVTEFCAGTDFTSADQALSAMTVKFNN